MIKGIGVILGSALVIAGAGQAQGQEVTSTFEQQHFLKGLERTTTYAGYDDDRLAASSSIIRYDSATEKKQERAIGLSLETAIGEFSIGAQERQTERLTGEEAEDLFAIGYRRKGIDITLAGGEEARLARVDYKINDKFSVTGSYQERLNPLDNTMVRAIADPHPQTLLFGLMPTRADIPMLHWNTKVTGVTGGISYTGGDQKFVTEFTSGRRPFLGVGEERRFETIKIGHTLNKRFHDTTTLELSKSENLFEGRIFTNFGTTHNRFKWDLTGYLHGSNPRLEQITSAYSGAGGGFRAMTRVKDWWFGPYCAFEKDQQSATKTTNAGISIERKGWEVMVGVNRTDRGMRRFYEETAGGFAAIKTKFGPVDVRAMVGVDSEPYGRLDIGVWKR